MAEIPNEYGTNYLTTEGVDTIFRSRNSMDYVSEGSKDVSIRSRFWESPALDDSTETGSELSSIE